jgi:hypothetical protein
MSVIEAFKLAFLTLTYSYPTLGGTNRVINDCLTILVFQVYLYKGLFKHRFQLHTSNNAFAK